MSANELVPLDEEFESVFTFLKTINIKQISRGENNMRKVKHFTYCGAPVGGGRTIVAIKAAVDGIEQEKRVLYLTSELCSSDLDLLMIAEHIRREEHCVTKNAYDFVMILNRRDEEVRYLLNHSTEIVHARSPKILRTHNLTNTDLFNMYYEYYPDLIVLDCVTGWRNCEQLLEEFRLDRTDIFVSDLK